MIARSISNMEQRVVAANELDTGTWKVVVRAASISSDYQPFAVVANKGFKDVNFLNCKILDVDKWVSPKSYLPDATPDLRFAVYSKEGIYLKGTDYQPKYSWSTDSGSEWSNWYSLGSDGYCYSDADCSDTLTSDTHTKVTYIRINEVPFNQHSYNENMIKLKVCGDTYTEVQYTIPVGAIAYADAEDGDDTDGSGSQSHPWKTISHAQSKISGDQNHQCTINLRGDTDAGMQYEKIVMEQYVDIVGGYDSNWNQKESHISTINMENYQDTSGVTAASNCMIKGITIKNTSDSAGIYIHNKTDFVIEECLLENNDSGIYVYSGSDITINNSTIEENPNAGIYLENVGDDIAISSCLFKGDTN